MDSKLDAADVLNCNINYTPLQVSFKPACVHGHQMTVNTQRIQNLGIINDSYKSSTTLHCQLTIKDAAATRSTELPPQKQQASSLPVYPVAKWQLTPNGFKTNVQLMTHKIINYTPLPANHQGRRSHMLDWNPTSTATDNHNKDPQPHNQTPQKPIPQTT